MQKITIVYEDTQVIVCEKPAGLAVQNASFMRKDLESMVRTYLAETQNGAEPYLGVVHRLDQPVQGLIVFAKTKTAAAELGRQVQDGRMEKEYQAVVCKKMPQSSGTLEHYLKKDPKTNLSRVVKKEIPGAKKATLDYWVLEETQAFQLVRIQLHTGRHHQIRVQMAAVGAPLYGDRKYHPAAEQEGQHELALCAARLAFIHPTKKKKMEFTCEPKGEGFLYIEEGRQGKNV